MKKLKEHKWYLMSCSFPDLNWARLTVYLDGSAEVFDCDGRTTAFASAEEARHWLLEDEFLALENLDDEDERELGRPLSSITPPSGNSKEDLLAQMFERQR
jgi:hypothetical protein